MPKVTQVNSARKPIPSAGVEVGDSYYWWKFMHGPKMVSKTYPKPQQLTRSNFRIAVLDVGDMVDGIDCDTMESVEGGVPDIISAVEEIRDNCQESFDNMPDNLQSSPTAELLDERMSNADEAISELEGLEFEEDPDHDDEQKSEAAGEKVEEIREAISMLDG